MVLGAEPNVFIPSDREIPRSVNEGIPITLSRPQSYAAASFHDLAGILLGKAANGEAAAVGGEPDRVPVASTPSRSLFRFRRK
jgi:MinD-like ATPase involved in chromosome partitioning or flagellar assembly